MSGVALSRVWVLVLVGVFLIPVGLSSLRGLTHVLTCSEQIGTPFTLIVEESGSPTLLSSRVIERDDERGLCGGLVVELSAAATPDGQVAITVPVTNASEATWRGTIQLSLGGTRIPVAVGRVGPGQTEVDTVELRLPVGAHELDGQLLIGP